MVGCGLVTGRETMSSLSPRQTEILNLVAEGEPDKMIGARLGISENTVETHMRAILARLEARNRSNAVYRFFGVLAGRATKAGTA